MIGIPTETREEVEFTFDLMCELKRLGAKTQLWIMTPYPGTEAIDLISIKTRSSGLIGGENSGSMMFSLHYLVRLMQISSKDMDP